MRVEPDLMATPTTNNWKKSLGMLIAAYSGLLMAHANIYQLEKGFGNANCGILKFVDGPRQKVTTGRRNSREQG